MVAYSVVIYVALELSEFKLSKYEEVLVLVLSNIVGFEGFFFFFIFVCLLFGFFGFACFYLCGVFLHLWAV